MNMPLLRTSEKRKHRKTDTKRIYPMQCQSCGDLVPWLSKRGELWVCDQCREMINPDHFTLLDTGEDLK